MNNQSNDPQTHQDAAFERSVIDFVRAFELVFHYDWTWTVMNLRYPRSATEANERPKSTFVEPGSPLAEACEDWRYREHLLIKYREVVKMLKQRGVPPLCDDPTENQDDWWFDRTDCPGPWRDDAQAD